MIARLLACSAGLCVIAAIAGCGTDRSEVLTIRYQLPASLVADLARIETAIAIDGARDPRRFPEDVPFRTVGPGVGYEVRDFREQGAREVHLVHDRSIGFLPSAEVTVRLGRPVSAPPPMLVTAWVLAGGVIISSVGPRAALFGGDELTIAFIDPRCGGVYCEDNAACCEGRCVDVNSDEAACGGCGVACAPGEVCEAGRCSCAGGSPCAMGETCCVGLGCVASTSDAKNCGGCGTACGLGEACVDSKCTCGSSAACAVGQLCCDGTCTTGTGCACGGNSCDASAPLCCASSCVDTQTSAQNCGQCGKSCAAPLACAGGQCKCEGQFLCAGGDQCCPGVGCRAVGSDPAHCTGCGLACQPGETCMGGTCRCGAVTCSAGQACCSGQCVNTSNDSANCGVCGKVCRVGEQCAAGVCKCFFGQPTVSKVCAATETCCPGAGYDDGCRDLTNDDKNCGLCGRACMSGSEACSSSECTCWPPCTSGSCCPGQGCFDTDSDEMHCGANCGACEPGQECRSGNCYY